MKKLSFYIAIAVMFGIAITSCKKKDKNISVENVTIVMPSGTNNTLTVGASVTLTVTVTPEKATNKGVTVVSDKPAVVSVAEGSTNWTLKAESVGTAKITATAKDGSKKSMSVDITVVPVQNPVTSLTVNPKTMSLVVGEKRTVSATVVPSGSAITWSSNNTAAATVNATGEVTAVAADKGTAAIIATAGDKKDTCMVTVTTADERTPTSISVSTQPTQRNYGIMEPFNPAGMVVTANYATGSPTTVQGDDSGLTFEYDFAAAGSNRAVTVKYKGVAAQITSGITVQTLNQRVSGATTTAVIRLYADETVTSNISISSKNITLVGEGGRRTVKSSITNHRLFDVSSNGLLTLEENVTLEGSSGSTFSLVYVSGANSVFTMKPGSIITKNINTSISYHGGAVWVDNATASFVMEGGKISSNEAARHGGGVFVNQGSFTMSGGEIKDNTLGTTTAYFGSDVIIFGATATFNLSGNADIGSIALYASSNSVKSKITVSNNFSGSVGSLDLAGNSATLATSRGYWTTSAVQVIAPTTGQQLSKALLEKFTLRNFVSSNGSLTENIPSGDGTPGSFGYHLYGTQSGETETAKMGTLEANEPTTPPSPVSIAVTTNPTQTDYGLMEPLNPAGMVVTITYDYGPTSTVQGGNTDLTYNFNFSATTTNAQVQVIYKGLLVTQIANNIIRVRSLNDRISAATTATIRLYADETITTNISISSKNITLVGEGGRRIVKSTITNHRLFDVSSNGQLTLDANVTLEGSTNATWALVYLHGANSVFTMKTGSIITGNTSVGSAGYHGGAVLLDGATASFVMEGGEITGNEAARHGGGVYMNAGTFTMSGGKITGNRLTASTGYFGSDVMVFGASVSFNLSGNAEVGNIALYATSNSVKSKITVSSNFTGSVASLDLAGSSATLADSRGFWTTSSVQVVAPATGATLTKAILDRFTLRNFVNSNGSGTGSITAGYHLYGTIASETVPALMGTLVAN
jgi:hypothetical protein